MQRNGKMRAAILTAPNRIQLREVDMPEPGEGAVLIRVEGCGLCGSNLPPWEGRPWFTYPFAPGAPGHEGWGRIEALGPNVKKFSVGERVAMLSYHAFAEYDVAHENTLVRLPSSLNKKPFPGEALGCAMNVFRRCQIEPGQTIAIVGIGFLGALLTALAARAGAHVIAISRRKFALNTALEFGAAEAIPMDDYCQITERIKKLTTEKGCDCVIEAVGIQRPLDLAGELTRERGRLIIAGYHQEGPRQVNMQLWNWRGLDVINAHERDPNTYRQGMQTAVEAVAAGELDPSPLYTHTFELDEIPSAFDAMSDKPKNFLKALVKI